MVRKTYAVSKLFSFKEALDIAKEKAKEESLFCDPDNGETAFFSTQNREEYWYFQFTDMEAVMAVVFKESEPTEKRMKRKLDLLNNSTN